MDYDALTPAQLRAYRDAVARTHRREVSAVVRRLSDSKRVASIPPRKWMGGSTQGDVNRSPVTFLECDILDDDNALDWTHGAHRRYEMQVTVSVFVPAVDDWVDRVVHTGPIWDFDRQGPAVRMVVEGPEHRAMGSVREAQNWKARVRAVVPIRELLLAAGARARDLLIPNLKATLPRDVTVAVERGKKRDDKKKAPRRRLRVTPEDSYWAPALEIAESLDRDLYGDGEGRFLLRKPPSRSGHTFSKRQILAPVVTTRSDDEDATNHWVVLGANPEGPKPRVQAEVPLPRRNKASAWSRRWNGKPRKEIVTIENPHLRTNRDAQRVGERHRDRALRELVNHQVEALPVLTWIRPNMLVTVPTDAGRAVTRVKQWTIPLGPGPDPLVINGNRRRGR